MTLENEIKQDKMQAMRDKDTLKKNVLTLIASRIQNKKIEKKVKHLSHEEEVELVAVELKQTKDALEGAEKAKRQDLIDSEKAKIRILETYMPQQLTEQEIITEVKMLVTNDMSMGEAMKLVMPTMKGRAENRLVSTVVSKVVKGEV